MDKWEELREHGKIQKQKAEKVGGSIGNIVGHVWQDVLNKMWSLEKQDKKQS